MYDAIVAGLGGMGSAAAYQLAGRGKRVLRLESAPPRRPLLIVGAGTQARAHLAAFREGLGVSQVFLTSRTIVFNSVGCTLLDLAAARTAFGPRKAHERLSIPDENRFLDCRPSNACSQSTSIGCSR
ncbi:MAG: 1-piperideine-2-carboxylate/1-pyrroline-2-carboxylate reductase [Rubrobacteraceae bacterium]|jgi:ornithine cyclodeaminase/alanine dehydrogenase-like protein (mu-crystallin family)|nr:1-piperideine-2-carboxylate/1-pyrroline-2-carboxylate reductase [Rubrobacteraceae bacterium]